MSIPVRVRGVVEADVDIIGIDIPDPKAGAAYLVIDRTDNQVRHSLGMSLPMELREPPLTEDGVDP